MTNFLNGAGIGAAVMLLFLAVLRLAEIHDTLYRISTQLGLLVIAARAESKLFDQTMREQGVNCLARFVSTHAPETSSGTNAS